MENSFENDIASIIKQVLTENVSLDPAFCKALLQQPPITTLSANVTFPKPMEDTFSPGLRLLTGYPSYPLYNRLIETLIHWITTGECPVYELPTMFLLNEGPALEVREQYFHNISGNWDDIGRELGVSYNERQILKAEGTMSTAASKLETVLLKWVESECSDVTWSKVIQVLSILQFYDLMESTKLFLKREDILDKYFNY